jgi:hypothetical protein
MGLVSFGSKTFVEMHVMAAEQPREKGNSQRSAPDYTTKTLLAPQAKA